MTLAHVPRGELAGSAREYARDARAPSTRLAYNRDWRAFVRWARSKGFVQSPPIPGEIVALHVAELADVGKSFSVISRRVTTIAQACSLAGEASPFASPALREVLRGIKRRYALDGKRPKGKAALELEDLRKVLAVCPRWLNGLRDRALLVVGWTGAFRRSELAALEVADLEERPEGYAVHIRRSKTDQLGKGQTKILPFGSDVNTCPVRTLKAWLEVAGVVDGRVFRSVDQHSNVGAGLTGRAVADMIKRRVADAGLDPKKYAGHSLRSGFCTTAAKRGKNPKAIMAQTGHRTAEMVLRYVRAANLFEDNAATGVGL
jgi:integrase